MLVGLVTRCDGEVSGARGRNLARRAEEASIRLEFFSGEVLIELVLSVRVIKGHSQELIFQSLVVKTFVQSNVLTVAFIKLVGSAFEFASVILPEVFFHLSLFRFGVVGGPAIRPLADIAGLLTKAANATRPAAGSVAALSAASAVVPVISVATVSPQEGLRIITVSM